MQPSPTPEEVENIEKEKELKTEELTLDIDTNQKYKMKISYGKINLIFFIESLNDFPRQYYELNTFISTIQKQDENFYLFPNCEKLVRAIQKCIKGRKYKISCTSEMFKLTIENDFFENNFATINIPSKAQDLNIQVNSLIQVISNLKKDLEKTNNDLKKTNEELNQSKNQLNEAKEEIKKANELIKKNTEIINQLKNEKQKEEEQKQNKIKFAKQTFETTNILNDEEKILISEWIHPKKVLKFNMVFNTSKDGSSASTFHYYCDGVSPTVTIVRDTNGNKFGGYTTSTWNQPGPGANYGRDQNAFIFNLSKKIKYLQTDKFVQRSIYRHNSYGPVFGSGYCLYLANGCTGNGESYTNSTSDYKTDGKNLFGNSGTTNFQVSYYEVYHVVEE